MKKTITFILFVLMVLSLFSCGKTETPSAIPETATPAVTTEPFTTPDEEENIYEKYLQYIYVLDDTYDMYWDTLNHENILDLKEIGEMQWLPEEDTERIDKEWAKELIDYKLKKTLNTEGTQFLSYEYAGSDKLKSLLHDGELYISFYFDTKYLRVDGLHDISPEQPRYSSSHLLIPLWVLTDVVQ